MEGILLTKIEQYKSNKICLYGLGKHTEEILQGVGDCNILGILDGYKTEGIFCNKPILSIEEAIQQGVEIIVIIARESSTKIIHRRIADICKQNNICIWDSSGKEIGNKKQNKKEKRNLYQSREQAEKSILEHDIITFDLFDTLLMRKTLSPRDVFEVLGKCYKRFTEYRTFAEQTLYNQGKIPDIYSIYNEMVKEQLYTAQEAEKIMQQEIALEKKLLVPRKSVVDLLQYAKKNQKKVIIVSDMYFTKEIIEEILLEQKIEGIDDIFVSCEYKTDKEHGLYNIVKNRFPNKTFLHIGDDSYIDGNCVQRAGADSIILPKAYDLMEDSEYAGLLQEAKTIEEKVELGILISKRFQNPFFSDTNKWSEVDIGNFIAPILIQFILWMEKKLYQGKYTSILFVARDGFFIKELFDRYCCKRSKNTIKSIYFQMSRTVGELAACFKEEDIETISQIPFSGSIQEMIKKRFHIEWENVKSENDLIAEEKEDSTKKNREKILKKAKQQRENYLKYISGLGIKKEDKIAFFDFVSSGTCQWCFQKVSGFDITGFYLKRLKSEEKGKQNLQIESMVEGQSEVDKFYLLLELFIKAMQPTVYEYNKEGNIIYNKEENILDRERNKTKENFVREVQNAVRTYLEEFLEIFQIIEIEGAEIETDWKLSDKILGMLEKIDIKFLDITIYDEFCGRQYSVNDFIG